MVQDAQDEQHDALLSRTLLHRDITELVLQWVASSDTAADDLVSCFAVCKVWRDVFLEASFYERATEQILHRHGYVPARHASSPAEDPPQLRRRLLAAAGATTRAFLFGAEVCSLLWEQPGCRCGLGPPPPPAATASSGDEDAEGSLRRMLGALLPAGARHTSRHAGCVAEQAGARLAEHAGEATGGRCGGGLVGSSHGAKSVQGRTLMLLPHGKALSLMPEMGVLPVRRWREDEGAAEFVPGSGTRVRWARLPLRMTRWGVPRGARGDDPVQSMRVFWSGDVPEDFALRRARRPERCGVCGLLREGPGSGVEDWAMVGSTGAVFWAAETPASKDVGTWMEARGVDMRGEGPPFAVPVGLAQHWTLEHGSCPLEPSQWALAEVVVSEGEGCRVRLLVPTLSLAWSAVGSGVGEDD